MVPPSSHRIPRVLWYSGYCLPSSVFVYGAITLYCLPSHAVQLTLLIHYAVRTPETFLLPVWPLPRSLATTCGISFDFSSSPYLDVSVQAVPLIQLWIHCMIHGNYPMWISPFGHLRIKSLLATPRNFSQLATSFIGSQCQGIRPAPFVA